MVRSTMPVANETTESPQALAEDNRILAETIPKVAITLIWSTLYYAIGDILVPGSVELEFTYYFIALLIPVATLLANSFTGWSPRVVLLTTDLVWSFLISIGLYAPNATVSGTAFILSMKWLASALLLPWPVKLQLLSTSVGLVLYFGALVASEHVGHLYVHQWALPPVAAILSLIGSRTLNRSRRQTRAHSRLLEESERQLRALLDSSPDGMLVAQNGRVVFANERVGLLLGHASPQDLIGRNVGEIMLERDEPSIHAFLSRAENATGTLPAVLVRLKRTDETLVPVAVNAAPVSYRGVASTQITFRDMTATRRNLLLIEGERLVLEEIASGVSLENQLQAICRFIERLEPESISSILVVDEDGKHLRHGAAPSLPQAYNDKIDGLDIREGNGSCGTAAARRQPVIAYDTQEDPHWGEYRELALEHGLAACWSTPILASSGDLLGSFAIYRRTPSAPSEESTALIERATHLASIALQRHRLEHSQAQQAEVFATLANVGQVLIASLETPVLLDRLCQSMRQALHADVSHVMLRDSEDDCYVPWAGAGDAPEVWEALRVSRFPSARIAGLLARLRTEGLVQISAAANAALLPEGMQSVYGVRCGLFVALHRGDELIGTLTAGYTMHALPFTAHQERIARGIAQLASLALENSRLVEELDEANRIKSNFVATMSHELRTPLNVLIGYQDLLLADEFGPLSKEQQEILRRLGFHARQLLVLVNDTLDLSRLEAGKMQIETEEIVLPAFIERVHKEAEEAWGHRGLALRFTVEGEPILRSDAAKLNVILRSLLANAVKFTESGSVELTVAARDGGVELTVADTGIGIPESALALIFEPFTQASATVASRFGGAGLGLHIAKRLVELLGGTITVESEVGKGSTFRVWLGHHPLPPGRDGALLRPNKTMSSPR